MILGRLAGVFGALAVGLGAFGAHALAARLDDRTKVVWQTATLYLWVHTLAILALWAASARAPNGRWNACGYLFSLGILLFSGSLYALALGAPRWVGAVTPLGGLVWIGAWLLVACSTNLGAY